MTPTVQQVKNKRSMQPAHADAAARNDQNAGTAASVFGNGYSASTSAHFEMISLGVISLGDNAIHGTAFDLVAAQDGTGVPSATCKEGRRDLTPADPFELSWGQGAARMSRR